MKIFGGLMFTITATVLLVFMYIAVWPAWQKATYNTEVQLAKKQAEELAGGGNNHKVYSVVMIDTGKDGERTLVLEDQQAAGVWLMFEACTEEQASANVGDKISFVFNKETIPQGDKTKTAEKAKTMESCYLGMSRVAMLQPGQ